MGLFGKKETTVQPVEEEVKQVEQKLSNGTVIAEGMTLEGNFETDEQMDIFGTVKGNIKSSVDAHVAESGSHIGKMDVKSLHADGTLDSEVVCSELASLSSGARFSGILTTANFDAAHGSNFDGKLLLKNNAAPVESESEKQAE